MFPLKELKEELKKAGEADQELQQFGAEKHRYQWNPPASIEEVEAFEEKIGVRLPQDYRDFLLQAGNGGAGPYYGLFSLQEVQDWLTWNDVRPDKEALLYPGIPPYEEEEWDEDEDLEDDDLEEASQEDQNEEEQPEHGYGLDGCIPILSQGCSYFAYLLVTGPYRGRVVYVEAEFSYIFFPRETDFLSWYRRWLREIANGYKIFWFGTNLDGDEETLCQLYDEADSMEEKKEILSSMEKFPTLSDALVSLVIKAAGDYVKEPDARWFLELLYRASPEHKDAFLEQRWADGKYDALIYEIYDSIQYLHEDEQKVLGHWSQRILQVLPRLDQSNWYTAFQLLTNAPEVRLRDVIGLWEIAGPRARPELIRAFGRFPDAKDHLDFFLKLMEDQEDLDFLGCVFLALPKIADRKLLSRLEQICEELPENTRIFQSAHHARDAVQEAIINPPIPGAPRPQVLRLFPDQPWAKRPDPPAIHPLIALVLQEQYGYLPASKSEWHRLLQKIKVLKLIVRERYIFYQYPGRIDLQKPDEYGFPDRNYPYDPRDWSAIGWMTNLKHLVIEEICVEDFSFLPNCRKLEKLSLYNTNFSDCRLLLELPNLKQVDLRKCRLEHMEALDGIEVIH